MKELLKCKAVIIATIMILVGFSGLTNTALVANAFDSQRVSGAKVVAEADLKRQLNQIELESTMLALTLADK